MALEAGTRLGHYEVVSSLGAGGMGEVYRAKDTKLGREVAVKLLLDEVSTDPERLARFEREARVLASLNHKNIASLHAFEREGDIGFLVMELVEGETLADRLARGPIPVDEALPLFVQIAEGLEAAHEKGVIHRDLKPANIKVTDDGQVKILDFGLAKAMAVEASASEDGGLSESPTLTLAATQRGQILGTAAYMAPEQARGKTVDKRADVWAFGVCLFEALSGKRVFEGEDASITLASVLKSDPDWERLPGDTPRKLQELLRRCLSKDPWQRLHDIGDARIEIEEAIAAPEDEETPGADAKEKRSPVPLTLAALAAVAVITGFVVWTLRPAPPERPVVRSVLSAAPSAPVRVFPRGRDLAVTPDGRVVVYQSEGSLYVRPVDRLVGSQLAGTEGALAPFLSPDGAWVGFASGGALKKVSILGGPIVTLADIPGGIFPGASWGADDTIILGSRSEALYRVSGGGGEPELLVAPDPERGEISYRFPDVLPGGEAVVFNLFTSASVEQAQIVVHSLATGEQKVLVSGGAGARYVPTGHLVYGLSGTLRAVAFDEENLEVRGSPVPVQQGVSTKPNGAVNFDFSQDGSLVYVTGGAEGGVQQTLVWVGRDGREEALSAPPRAYEYPRISPDGQRVAVSSRDEDEDVWIWDLGRETLDRLTRDPGQNLYSVWTPDSREVVFGSNRGGTFDVYQRAADGTGAVKPLTESTDGLFPSSISPDGKLLVYLTRPLVRADLGVLSLEGEGAPEPLLASEFSERNGEISPDGRFLAYQSDESGEDEIYVRPFPEVDGGRFPISAGGGSEPLWSPDGSEIFYRAGDRMMAVPVTTEPAFEAGSPEELFTGSYAVRIGRMYDIHPDGQRFLMVKPAETAEDLGNQVILVQNWFEELKRLVPTD